MSSSSRLLAVLLAAVPSLLVAAPPAARAEEDRPRIGLVLSGGGARGAAHVGVLEVLEEYRIPIDVVAGTSMGSIVGGLYAMGMSPEQMKEVLGSLDWNELFQDRTGRRELSFRRKEDDRRFLAKFRLGISDWKVKLPTGLIQGQKLLAELGFLTLPVATIRNFDDLPIPYRAVAADIETGLPVVLDHGNLADSIRASMAVPGAFAPVEIDGKLLVDGGIAMNLPVEVVQKLGVDIVIAVDIGTPRNAKANLESALAIGGQVFTIQINQNTEHEIRRLEASDVLIQPELEDITTASFDKVLKAAMLGEKGAREVGTELAELSVSEEEYAIWLAGQRLPPAPPRTIDSIRVDNDSVLSEEAVRGIMKLEPGDLLERESLRKDLGRLYGLDFFDQVSFQVDEGAEGETELAIRVRKRKTGRDQLRFGLLLESDLTDASDFNLLLNLTRLPLNKMGGDWRNDFILGENTTIASEIFQPLDHGERYFISPAIAWGMSSVQLFDEEGTGLARYRTWTAGAGLALGRQLGQWGEVRAGIGYSYSRANRRNGLPILGIDELERGTVFTALRLDTLDDVRFPTRGGVGQLRFDFDLEGLGSDEDSVSIQFDYTQALSWGRTTFLLNAELSKTFDNVDTVDRFFFLGGFLRLSGLRPDELVGTQAALLTLRIQRQLANPGFAQFRFPLYVGISGEGGNSWLAPEDPDFDSMRYGGSAYFAVGTPIAPLYIAYGFTNPDRHAAYLFLGQTF